jgi:hypothetical protein
MQKKFTIPGSHNDLSNAGSFATSMDDQVGRPSLFDAGIQDLSDSTGFLNLEAGAPVTPYPNQISGFYNAYPFPAPELSAVSLAPSPSAAIPSATTKMSGPEVVPVSSGMASSSASMSGATVAAVPRSVTSATPNASQSGVVPTSSGTGGFVINGALDSSITSLQSTNPTLFSGIVGAISSAIGYFESIFTNSMTVTIDFGWGEYNNIAITGTTAVAESIASNLVNTTYSGLVAALTKADTSAVGLAAVASLPASDPTTSVANPSIWAMNAAEALALGLPGASQGLFAGYVGLNTAFNFTFDPNNRAVPGKMDAIGVLEHEISEDLGRLGSMGIKDGTSVFTPIDLFRYTAPGVPQYRETATNAYFSVDGKTLQTEYNNPISGGDAVDWNGSVIGDAFGSVAPGVQNNVSATDLQVMNILGYTETSAPPSSNLIWTGHGAAGDYNDIANWSPKRLPAAGDDLVIPTGADVVFVNDQTAEVDSLQMAAGSTFEIDQGDFTIDNAGTSTTNLGTIDIGTGALSVSVQLGGTTVNYGQIRFYSPAQIITNDSTVVIGGTGTIALVQGDIGGRNFSDASPFDTFINLSNTIQGSGAIGLNGFLNSLNFVNAGVVDANVSGVPLRLNAAMVNKGIMEAANGARLILNGPVNNAINAAGTGGGIIEALTGGTVELDAVTIIGGTLGAAGSTGAIEIAGATTLDGTNSTFPGISLNGSIGVDAGASVTLLGQMNGGTLGATLGQFLVSNGTLNGLTLLSNADLEVIGSTLALKGTIINHGTIQVIGGPGGATATLRTIGTVTLTGGGTVALSDGSGAGSATPQLITGTVATDTLDNFNNTITGYGRLGAGDGLLTLINEAGGKVVAAGGSLIVATGAHAIVNKGLLDSSSGVLDLRGSVTNTGTIAADGGTTELDGATVSGGTFATSAGGVVLAVGTATLNGLLSPITLAAGAQVTAGPGSTVVLEGSIVNHGILDITGDVGGGVTATGRILGSATLTGGGTVFLSSTNGNATSAFEVLTGATGSAKLDNIDNTIVGYGSIGAGPLTLVNEIGGTIKAAGGALVVNTGATFLTNKGLMAAVGGTLAVQSTIDGTLGGTLAALDAAVGAPGVILLDGGTVHGGTVRTDLTDSASQLTDSSNGGTLDGSAAVVTLASGAQVVAAAGGVLSLKGSIVNHGTLSLAGDSYNVVTAAVRIVNAVTLSGGGKVSLYSLNNGPSSADQIISGTTATAKLDNADNTILGYGMLGAGQLTLVNELAGTIEAAGGALIVNTGTNVVSNLGLMQAFGGTLVVQGIVDDTKGGVVATLNNGTVSGIVELDGGTLRGGTLRTDPTDSASQVQATANGGTLDGTAGALTLATGAIVDVIPNGTLTIQGTIANHGTLAVTGNGYYGYLAEMLIAGTASLTGGGLLSLTDGSTVSNATNTQVLTGASAAATLDNVDNLIRGYGELGNTQLTLINEVKGTIEAAGGNLVVDTGAKVITNKGLMEADGGTLTLHGVINDTSGSTIAALNNGTVSGVVLLDGATLRGGTIVTDTHDLASVLTTTTNGGTLDGTAGAITLATGAQVQVANSLTLTVAGTIAGAGTLSVLGNGYYGYIATAELASNVTLTGGGSVVLADISTVSTATATQVITGASASVTLNNVSDTIRGYGSLGAGSMTLVNASGGLVDATGGTLKVDTGAKTITNQGMLEAVGGTLEIDSAVTNTGTILAGAGGDVTIDGTVANTGLVTIGNGGTVTLHGAITGATSKVQIAGGGTLVIDGGSLRNGTLTNAAGGIVDVVQSSGTLASVAFSNAGTANITGNGYYGYVGMLSISGTTTLSGGGSVVLSDDSTVSTATSTQILTGVAAGDTLDNVDNTISGYGELGAGQLTLINETKATIEATTGILLVNTGSVALANHGLLEANGGTLMVQTVVNDTVGGSIAAVSHGTVAGVVLLDGGTLRGGSITTDAASALLITSAGGTLDGTAGAVTLAVGSQATVAPGEVLTLKGPITEDGTLTLQGNGYYGYVGQVLVGGTLTLASGALVTMADLSTISTASATQVIAGTAAGAKLDNSALISGYGMLGNGTLALINEVPGTIKATGGILVVDSGASNATNLGQMIAVGGTLQIENTLTNTSTIAVGAGGGIVVDGVVANSGLISIASTGTMTLNGSVVGTASKLQIAGGGTLAIDGGTLRGGTLTAVANSAVNIVATSGTLASVAFGNSGTTSIIGNGYYGYVATMAVSGTTTLSGGGAVVLVDDSTITTATSTQIITGVAAGDTLDNVDNIISGYGEIGAGQLTLINETKGTIEATVAALVINTGSVALVNHGLLEANGGTLVVQTVVDDTKGGTIVALSSVTGPGQILLDGGTLRGGTVSLDSTSALLVTTAGGTLDGTAGTLTLSAGSHATVVAGEVLTLQGVIANHGRIDLQGNGYYGAVAQIQVGGTVALSGGGVIALADTSGSTTASSTQVITSITPGAKLDNIDNTINGYGLLGNSQVTVVNEAAGTIDASGGDLIVDVGTGGSLANAGLMQALSGTLDVVSGFTNSGTVIADGGAVVLEGSVSGTGKLEVDGSQLTLMGSVGTGQTILFGNFGKVETLNIAEPNLLGATIGGFASGDTIIVQNSSLTAANYIAGTGTLGSLVLMSGTAPQGTLTLAGSYIQSNFAVQAQADGTSVVSLVPGVGTIYNHATASAGAPNPVAFGQHHVGDVLTRTLSVSNTGTVGARTETLDAAIGNTTGPITASGAFTALAPGKSDTSHLTVGLTATQDGVESGSAILALLSDSNGIDGIGSTPLASQTIAVSGTLYNYATASLVAPVNFGAHHVGDKLSTLLSVINTGTADGFTEKLDASFGGTTGSVTAAGSFTLLAASATNSTGLTVGLTSAQDGVRSGSAALTLKSDGTGVDVLGTHTLTTQTIGLTGTLYNYATASTVAAVNFGNRHVGDTLSQALSIINTGTADGFTEALDASIGGASTGITANGTFTGLGASVTNGTSLTIGLTSATTGKHSGTAVISLTSDGTGIDNLGTKALASQTIATTATVYALAAPILSAGTLNFGAARIGGTLNTGTVTLRDGTVANGFQESLVYAVSGPAGMSTTGGAGTIVAGGSAQVGFILSTATAGTFSGTPASIALTSTGIGTSGLANTTLTAAAVTLNAKVYAPAIATLGTTSVDFGIVHVGKTAITKIVGVTNTGTGGLVDLLTGGKATDTGSVGGAAFALGAGVASGAAGSLTLSVTPALAGTIAGSAVLGFTSHDADLADIAIDGGTVTVTGTVNNFATAQVEKVGGAGTLTQNGTVFTLNLGSVRQNGQALVGDLGVLNAVAGPADLLSGSFAVAGTAGFANAGFNAFSGLGAGADERLQAVTLNTGSVGVFSETITLLGTGSNASGYSGALTTETVTVTGTVSLSNYATAIATLGTTSLNFGNVHVGANANQSVGITNTATGALVDLLTGGTATNSGAVTSDVFNLGTGLAGGISGTVQIGITAAAAGTFTGSAALGFTSHDSAQADIAINGGTVAVSGTAYALASPTLSTGTLALGSAGTLALGAARVGGTLGGLVTLHDGTVASPFQESLLYATSALAGLGISGGAGTIASGGSAQVGLILSTGTAGSFSVPASIALTSSGVGTSGLANSGLAPDAVTVTGKVYAPAVAKLLGTSLNFGIIHVGTAAVAKGDIVSNAATGALVDVLTGGSATKSGNVGSVLFNLGTAGVASGGSGSVTVGINTTTAGTITGSAVLGFTSHDADQADLGINGGTITVSGTIDNYATAKVEQTGGAGTLTQNGTAFTLNLGAVRQNGSALVGDLGVVNAVTGPADLLSGSFTVAGTTGFTNLGVAGFSFTNVAAGLDERSQVLTLNTGTVGVFSETITLFGTGSNASGYSGTLAPETIIVLGSVFAAAAPLASPTTISLGSVRVGGTLATATVQVSNGTTATAFQESLVYAASGPNVVGVTNGAGTILAGGTAQVGFTLNTATAGDFTGTQGTIALTSTGVGTDGLPNMSLAPDPVTINGKVYAPAIVALGTTSVNFGIVHVGASPVQTVGITNAATGALADLLTGGTATDSGSVSGVTFGLGTGVAAGGSGSLQVGINASQAGVIAGSAVLHFTSHDGDLSDIAINGGTVTVSGTVDNYATAQIELTGGVGTLTQSGTAFALNLGTVLQNGSGLVADLGVLNAASGPADLLAGSFTATSTAGFSNSGFVAFSGLVAGADERAQVLTLNTGTAGVFTETITLFGTGGNASGYSGTLATDTLTVTGTIISTGTTYTVPTAPLTIAGTSGNDTIYATAGVLNSHDLIDGGGGTNTLNLLGAGLFDLGAPKVLTNIQIVTAQENAAGTTVYMRDGLNVNLIVKPAASGSITIYGGADSDTFNLGVGTDTVVLGSPTETVYGGLGGTNLVQATAAQATALIGGAAIGTTTLEITTGGTVTLNPLDTRLTVKLDAATNLGLSSSLGFITAIGAVAGHDMLTAGFTNQTLQSIGGNDRLMGSGAFGDTFLGTAAGFAGDTIQGFGGTDVIDFSDIAFATIKPIAYSAATGQLVVSDATHSATVTMSGAYTLASFSAPQTDGHSGTLLKFV